MLSLAQSGKNRRSNFFYTFLFLPKGKRQAILTLYDFCRRTDDIIDGNDPVEKKWAALKEWREQLLGSLRRGSSDSDLAQIGVVVRRFGIPAELLLELIEGVAMDLIKNRYETFEDLQRYCYRVGSTVGLMSIEIFGYRNPSAKRYADSLGIALQLTNILRDLKTDAARGRIYLPLQDLRDHDYSESDLMHLKVNQQFEELIQFECERARSYFETAKRHLDKEDLRTLYPAEAMAIVYEKILNRIEREPSRIYEGKISVPTLTKFRVAFDSWMRHRVKLSHES